MHLPDACSTSRLELTLCDCGHVLSWVGVNDDDCSTGKGQKKRHGLYSYPLYLINADSCQYSALTGKHCQG